MNRKAAKIIISIILCIVSASIALQVRSMFLADTPESGGNIVMEETIQELAEAKAKNEELTARMTELQNEYDGRIKALGDDELELEIKELYDSLNSINVIACLSEVYGRGVVFSINDRSRYDIMPDDAVEQKKVIVHSHQVYTIVNELKKAGAQAISINRERIIPTTEIFCSGGNIKINGNMYVPPYEIKAVGNPDELYKAIISSEIYEEIVSRKLTVSLERNDSLTIPKYVGSIAKRISFLTEIKEKVNDNAG